MRCSDVGLEVLTAVAMNVAIFCVVRILTDYSYTLIFCSVDFDLDGGYTFLRNVGSYKDYTALYPRRLRHV
jgi:hypothetical protein